MESILSVESWVKLRIQKWFVYWGTPKVMSNVLVKLHFFTMFWVQLKFAMYGYMCQVSETLQYFKSIFSCIRCNRGLKNFFIRSAGAKVIATIRYILITLIYVLASHKNFWPRPLTGIKLVGSRSVLLRDKRMTMLGLLVDW